MVTMHRLLLLVLVVAMVVMLGFSLYFCCFIIFFFGNDGIRNGSGSLRTKSVPTRINRVAQSI